METEAYCENDAGAHCTYDKRPQEERRYDESRSQKMRRYFDAMYLKGGHVYIYADDFKKDVPVYCHLNFTTGPEGFCSAVLIRAIEPCRDSIEQMICRRQKFMKKTLNGTLLEQKLCSGPQRLCQALGIPFQLNGAFISETPLKLYGRKDEPVILHGPRVGVTRGAEKMRRYVLQCSHFVSERNNKRFPLPVDRA